MAEDRNLKERLVTGFERGGKRRRFNMEAKRELVLACLQPGVSVARIALEHGLNANLLRKWIRQHEQEAGGGVATNGVTKTMPAFVPVVQLDDVGTAVCEAHAASVPITQPSQLVAELPNGVMLRLACAGDDTTLMMAMIETLGRAHVPVRR
jgi:transposase